MKLQTLNEDELDIQKVTNLLEQLINEFPAIESITVSTREGLSVAHATISDFNTAKVNAMNAALTSLAECLCTELERTGKARILIESEQGPIITTSLGVNMVLTCVHKKGTTFDVAVKYSQECSESIETVVEKEY